jgi:hypothetical protein
VKESAVATDPRCSLCVPKDTEAHWVEVDAIGSNPERWRVTVDVTMELCAEHRRRLLQAVGMDDVNEYSPPPHPWALEGS